MTVSAQRQAIVDALNTMPADVYATVTVPASIVPGAAWPDWSQTTPVTACVYTHEYFVLVALPNGSTEATVNAGDELRGPLLAALWEVGNVQRVEPAQWAVEPGGQAIPVLRVTLEMSEP